MTTTTNETVRHGTDAELDDALDRANRIALDSTAILAVARIVIDRLRANEAAIRELRARRGTWRDRVDCSCVRPPPAVAPVAAPAGEAGADVAALCKRMRAKSEAFALCNREWHVKFGAVVTDADTRIDAAFADDLLAAHIAAACPANVIALCDRLDKMDAERAGAQSEALYDRAQRKAAEADREVIRDDRTSIRAKLEAAEWERASMRAERDEAKTALVAARAEIDRQAAQLHNDGWGERERLRASLAAVTADRDRLAAELALVYQDRDAMRLSLDAALTRAESVQSERDTGEDIGNASLDRMERERDDALEQVAWWRKERAAMVSYRAPDAVTVERDLLLERLAVMMTIRDQRAQEIRSLREENAVLRGKKPETPAAQLPSTFSGADGTKIETTK